jgi:NAD-dependent dihydropyrimidine dehydrogenase PreA subunit
MSRQWYPVIDYAKCTDCGACVDMCAHGVYDKLKTPSPVVVYPEGCVQGCKGCGNNCPSDAIQYVGDVKKKADCGCDSTCCG